MNVFGDHLFECMRHSKLALHNRCRDAYFVCTRTLGPVCIYFSHDQDVLLEPKQLTRKYPTKQPGDFAWRLFNWRSQYATFDNTILGLLPLVPSPENK